MCWSQQVWRCALAVMASLGLISGCQKPAPPPAAPVPVVLSPSQIDVYVDHGVLSHDLFMDNRSELSLESIDVTLTIASDGSETTAARHWGYWDPNEIKKLNIPAGVGRVQRIVMQGTAKVETLGRPVEIQGEWLFKYSQAK